MIEFSIVVVAYHSADDLATLIASIDEAAAGETWHLTIVNNATDAPIPPELAGDPRISIIETGANLGYSGGINRGRAEAPAARKTVVLNPDLTLGRGSLRELAGAIDRGADAAVPLIRDSAGNRQDSLRREPSLSRALGEAVFGDSWPSRPGPLSETVRDDEAYRREHDIDWATGAALMVRADIADAVGDWDDQRFFMYSEETDYARRLRAAGGRIRFVPSSIVEHAAGGSGSSRDLDALLEVNKLRYYRKWHGPMASAAFALALVVRNAARPHRAGARRALHALLSSTVRASLPGGAR